LEPAHATAAIAAAVIGAAAQAAVVTMGDHAYERGSREEFERCYEPTWGRFNALTFPSPGNHDLETDGGRPYYDYFIHYRRDPAARARGYYAFELGAWQLLALNSLVPLARGSAQLEWLRQELARAPHRCTLAYWHHPPRSSGWHGLLPWDPGRATIDAWQMLAAHGADIVLNGHDHIYERFEPQGAAGSPEASGIVQFIVGTGGGKAQPVPRRRPSSTYLRRRGHGVLVLALHAESYEWAYVGTDGVIHDRSAAEVPCR
jgi:3',5'-cyclic AMP phosphodiesterase CpdA